MELTASQARDLASAGPMERRLATYFELAFSETGDYKRIVERKIPRDLTVWHEGKVTKARELLLSTKIESTTLVQTQMYATVLEGAEPAKCFRNMLPIVKMTGPTIRVPRGAAGTYAPAISEGGDIHINQQDYGYTDITAIKYGDMPYITNELIEDSMYDVMAMEVRKAGERIENTLNLGCLKYLIDNATYEVDTGGVSGAQGIKAIAGARGLVKAAGWQPDSVVMCADAEAVVLKEFIPTSYIGAEAAMAGRLPNLLGLKVGLCDVALTTTSSPFASSSYTWDYDSDGEIGMVIFDSRNAAIIGMKRDISMKKVEDVTRDIFACPVTARFGINYIQAGAICRVEY